jgi:hypothetical protein
MWRSSKQLYSQARHQKRLEDDERPHAAIWWLAGGRMRRELPARGVPTAATLRERRIVENENRQEVGFWGNVAGAREIRKSRKELKDTCKEVADAGGRLEDDDVKDDVQDDAEADERRTRPDARATDDPPLIDLADRVVASEKCDTPHKRSEVADTIKADAAESPGEGFTTEDK